ncbi:RNA polymerase III, subunit C17 [Xylariomycetidae sp. FL0641]|nr:RNA polymerase III, subunit C17 [Xylariomycetidae sp. FL0641]
MRILEAQNATLSNLEVYTFLNNQAKQYQQQKRRGPGNLETLRRELIQYFESPPGPLSQKPLPFDVGAIPVLVKKLHPYGITKGECIMIINMRPTSVANLNAVIEDMADRFDEDKQYEIIDHVVEVMGQFPQPEEEEGAGDVMETTE